MNWCRSSVRRPAITSTSKLRPIRNSSAGEFGARGHAQLQAQDKRGRNSAITQYFYNADGYFRFVEECTQARRHCTHRARYHAYRTFLATRALFRCLRRRDPALDAQDDGRLRRRCESVQAFGLDIVTQLCEKLIAGGAPGLHFYTLNQANASLEILKRLGYR